MIKINLAMLLAEKRINQSDLRRATGIRSGTVNAYYHQYIKRINIDDLNSICKALNCKLDELIEYIPDKKS